MTLDELEAEAATAATPVAPAAAPDDAAELSFLTKKPKGAPGPASVSVEATKLSPSEETKYQAWKASLPERLRYEGDYDLRGFYKKNPKWSPDAPEAHMTDEFKLPNHPTFSNESRYYNDKTKHLGGHWTAGDVFVPNDTRSKKLVDEGKPSLSLDALEADAAAPPDRIGRANARFAEHVEGAKADRATVAHDQAANAGPGGAFMNGVANATRFGFGDELEGAASRAQDLIAGRKDGPTYQQYRDVIRDVDATHRAVHPYASAAGQTVGALAAPGGSAGAGAGRVGTALVAGAQGALAGAGNSTEDTLLGVARDAAVSGGLSAGLSAAVGSLVRRAPERVDERMLANIARGEAGGAAKPKLYQNMVTKAGEDAAELNETLARYPGVKETIATTAAAKPKVGVAATEKIIDKLDATVAPMYAKIDKGPASPKALQLMDRVLSMKTAMVEKGRTDIADALETFENHLAKHYGDGDAIKPTTPLTASMLRELRKGIGKVAFKDLAEANTPVGVEAKRMIYGAINDVIDEAAAATPGVDAAKLRLANKDMSQLIAVKDALADRSVKAAAGRTSLFQNILAGTAGGGAIAAMTHDPIGAAIGAVGTMGAIKGVKLAVGAGRHADFQLARLVQAARNGSTPAQLGQLAVELGLSEAAAEEISRRGIGAFNDQHPSDDLKPPKAGP